MAKAFDSQRALAVNGLADVMQASLDIMQQLRDPHTGCPWDLKQDFASIVPHTLEEAYEVADAIRENNFEHLKDELGDLLFQVVFYSQLAKEQALFDFTDVLQNLNAKLIRRHPHVFAQGEANTADDVALQWEQIKAQEKARGSEQATSVLDDIPKAMPALMRAQKMQKKAAQTGFDWPNKSEVFAKLKEEIAELEQAYHNNDEANIKEELGDALFCVVNLIRHSGFKSEQVMSEANAKFASRFRFVERKMAGSDFEAQACAELKAQRLAKMEEYWQQAKLIENNSADEDNE